MTPTSNLSLSPSTTPLAVSNADQPASWSRMLLVALPIVLPGMLVLIQTLPLPVRGVSAILTGLAVLLCGSYLLGQALERLALPSRHSTQSSSPRFAS